jgi:hypothetical protein
MSERKDGSNEGKGDFVKAGRYHQGYTGITATLFSPNAAP